ncbi:flavodoxin-like fold family protein [Collimonas fungivorans]|uniref:Flavodoxin-like fold family protein n=1 Tax=Collimonas fungivorans TaxID=158899 RepID=A0A127PD13_9BURK|nr:flavodoxin-like fold family protein [Collimonas fungivorans]
MQVLHIDSSISGAQSVSRQLSAGVVARLKETSPGLELIYRDLAAAPVPQQSPAILFAKLTSLHEMGALSGEIDAMIAAALQGGAGRMPQRSPSSPRPMSPWMNSWPRTLLSWVRRCTTLVFQAS